MASCLSVMELYGSKLLGLPALPQFPNMFQGSDPNLNWLLLARNAQLLNGMYGSPGGRDEAKDEQPRSYPSVGLPLHRSPAVFAALCNLARNEENEAGPSTSAPEEVTPHPDKPHTPTAEAQTVDELEAPSSDYYGRQAAPGAFRGHTNHHRRATPYTKSRPTAPSVYPMDRSPYLPANLSWFGALPTSSLMLPVPENMNKSFSAPAQLNLEIQGQQFPETVRISGGADQSFAVQTVAQRCVDRQTQEAYTEKAPAQVERERPHSLPTPRSPRGDTPTASHPTRTQQRDNFRRLTTSQGGNAQSSMSRRDIALQRHITSSLKTHGVCVIDKFLGDSLSSTIKAEAMRLHASDKCAKGQLLKGKDNVSIRGDIVAWMEGTEPECSNIGLLCQKLDSIVSNGAGVTPAYKICGGTKVMVARYPGSGARYQKHVDNPAKDGRCLTCIYYMNKDWDSSKMGGALRLWSQTSGKRADIDPIADRVVIFYSDARNPHEVLPCFNDRYAITLWYFDHDERAKALERIDSLAATSSKSNKE